MTSIRRASSAFLPTLAFAAVAALVGCADPVDENDAGSGGASSTSASAGGASTATTGSGGASTTSGAGGSGTPGEWSGRIYYSDYVGLYAVMEGSEPQQLMNDGSTDLRVITKLVPSPSGDAVAFEKAGTMRVVDGTSGDEVASWTGYKPWAWLDGDTLLVSTWAGNNAGEFFTLDLDGTEGTHFDTAQDYCTPSQTSLAPSGTKFAAACGYGNDGVLNIIDLDAQSESVTTSVEIAVAKAPVWTENDHLVWHGEYNGSLFHAPANDAESATQLSLPTNVVRLWGQNTVMAIGQEVGSGGANINAYRTVAIPGGDTTAIDWLTTENPVPEQVFLAHDGTRILYKKGSDVHVANADGSNDAVAASGLNIQSVAW